MTLTYIGDVLDDLDKDVERSILGHDDGLLCLGEETVDDAL